MVEHFPSEILTCMNVIITTTPFINETTIYIDFKVGIIINKELPNRQVDRRSGDPNTRLLDGNTTTLTAWLLKVDEDLTRYLNVYMIRLILWLILVCLNNQLLTYWMLHQAKKNIYLVENSLIHSVELWTHSFLDISTCIDVNIDIDLVNSASENDCFYRLRASSGDHNEVLREAPSPKGMKP